MLKGNQSIRMRKTTRTTRAKLETRSNPKLHNNNKSSFSSSPDDEMTGLGLFASSSSTSSSSSSSNLSPLAIPFTVERSNNNNNDFNFNAKSDIWSNSPNFQSSNPNPPITTPTTHNRSSNPASAIGPTQQCVIDAPFSTFSSPFNTSSTHNWSSMNSSVQSGLEHINPPAGGLYSMNANEQPRNWSFGNDDDSSDSDDAPMNLNFLPFGSSQGSYDQSFFGSKQAYGSQGKEDSSLFGCRHVSRENIIGSSTIGNSHSTSASSSTCHGHVSSGISNEAKFTWNGCTLPLETRSIYPYSSSDPAMKTESTSLFNKTNLPVSHNPLKEKESYQLVGFEHKSSLNSQVSDINSTEEVNSTAHLSEHLDHHNPAEDSPCWKGAISHCPSSASQEKVSSQHPIKKLQKSSAEDVLLTMDQGLHGTVVNAANVVTSECLDVNMVVKGLSNLSEMLLRLYLKDECGLKEHDYKAIDRVIANLNVCMSSEVQQVDPAQKCSSPKHITSNVLPEAVHRSPLHQERKNDQLGTDIEELQSAYIRDDGLPKDYNMVQKIKRVLDENLECTEELPSDPLLYKNLWLEAEAELCVSSYRTRLHRAKREIGKSKALDVSEATSDIKKIPSSNYSPTASKPLHEAAGSKTSNTHASNPSLPIVDDVENSVMARFNILKRREELNPVNMAEKEPAGVEASGNKIQSSGVAKEPHLRHLLDTGNMS